MQTFDERSELNSHYKCEQNALRTGINKQAEDCEDKCQF